MITHIAPGQRMSQVVIHNGLAYLAGQIADDPNGSIEAQTESVLAKVDRLLQQARSSRSHLLSVQIFLPHITDFDAMNGIYDSWIDPKSPPARACIEARLADPRLRIEVTAVAVVMDEA